MCACITTQVMQCSDSPSMVNACELLWPGDTGPARRAEHFFTETARVEEGARLWGAGDIAAFGALMNASGRSSAQNYEVMSHPELKACTSDQLRRSVLCAGFPPM